MRSVLRLLRPSVHAAENQAGLDALFPSSTAGSVLLQPAWNDSKAADWNAVLPYSGQDALAHSLLPQSHSTDDEALEETGPLTAQYRQHIRRASLDTRTL